MGYEVKIPMGDLVIKDYKTGEILAVGRLIEVKIIELPGGSKQFQLQTDSLEKFGSNKELTEEKISDSTETEGKE